MKKHHTKNKGDLGVLKAQVSLYEQGYLPLLPQSEHQEFDLVGYKDGKFKRVQVKYRRLSKGKIAINLKSSWADKKGNHTIQLDKSKVDLVCVYCPDTGDCYWFDPSKFGQSVTLRVFAPKNCQSVNVKRADNFLQVP